MQTRLLKDRSTFKKKNKRMDSTIFSAKSISGIRFGLLSAKFGKNSLHWQCKSRACRWAVDRNVLICSYMYLRLLVKGHFLLHLSEWVRLFVRRNDTSYWRGVFLSCSNFQLFHIPGMEEADSMVVIFELSVHAVVRSVVRVQQKVWLLETRTFLTC